MSQKFECRDVDDLAGCMKGWSVHLDQLSPGPFYGTLHEITLDSVQVLRERVNRALLKRGSTSSETISFSIPLETAGTGYCAGASLQTGTLLVSSGPSLPELRTPDEHDIAVVTVPTGAFRQLVSLGDDSTHSQLCDGPHLVTLTGQHYKALRSFLLTSFDALGEEIQALSYPQVSKALEDALLLEVVAVTEAAHDPIRLDQTARQRIVGRVRDLVNAKPDVPLTVLDVCRTIGTSRRKLQYCFEETLGTHPAYYLRILRLNAVRRELRRHSSQTGSVSDIASRQGFWHLSRFAGHYRQLFGELPSETLKRQD